MYRKLSAILAAGVLAFGLGASSARADDTVVYQGCPSLHTFDTDVNGIRVVCEPLDFYGNAGRWLPVLVPGSLSVHYEYDSCSVPGLVASKSGGGYLFCRTAFQGYYWLSATSSQIFG